MSNAVKRNRSVECFASFQSRFVNNFVQIWAHGLRELKDKQSWGIGVSVEYYARRKKAVAIIVQEIVMKMKFIMQNNWKLI